ncbi:MAG: folate-binding protein YgfZ [Gammaproteobacteria bacterium]|jgi:folate-binding protein YgfZ
MTDSDHYIGVLDCAGKDAESFLHGQFTSDIAAMQIGTYQRAAYCNPKGRVLSLFDVLKISDGHYQLLIQAGLIESILKRLRMFVMRAKVTFTHLSDLSVCSYEGHLQPSRGYFIQDGNLTILNVGISRDRYLSISEGQSAPLSTSWLLNDIEDGLPQVYVSTSEEFLPQAINLDLINAVNFQKGCYPGQEIVARLKYLGKLKQRMMIIKGCSSDKIPSPGDPVYCGEKKAGQIVMSAVTSDNQFTALALINIAKRDLPGFRLDNADIISLDVPPYPVPEFLDEPD